VKTDSVQALAIDGGKGLIWGMSQATQVLEGLIAEIAPTNIPVLLVGESGTGKEMLAHRIHRLSSHREEPLRKVSSAELSSTTFSSQFGLGAPNNGDALSNAAGTILFDEVSELDGACQRRLLYALPDGDEKERSGLLKMRVISTTNGKLDEEMRAGRFRPELYYRINGVRLRLPPLRERKEDIPPLVEAFLTKHATQLGRPRPCLSPRTVELFLEHSWPGNIRELENMVKKIVALGDESHAIADLEMSARDTRTVARPEAPACSLKMAARAASRGAERELILEALWRNRWNRKRAAHELQISYKSLLSKLKQIKLQDLDVQ
jgi:two-component system, NtrC family, response regulator AtoC